MKALFTLLFTLFSLSLAYGSCSGRLYMLSEVLNYDFNQQHIFTCEIIATYANNISYQSKAVVKTRFRGQAQDTVYISSGGMTTMGGQKLSPGSIWLIISPTKDNKHYGAAVCSNLSKPIAYAKSISYKNEYQLELGKIYLKLIQEYTAIEQSKYTGYKHFYAGEHLIASGAFKNGKADGSWTHYSYADNFREQKKFSTIAYKEGKLHGWYTHYNVFESSIIEWKQFYENNRVVKEIYRPELDRYNTLYQYLNEKDRIVFSIKIDSNTLEQDTICTNYQFGYQNKQFSIRYKHGYYEDKAFHLASDYRKPATGHYLHNAKVGNWIYYNKEGKAIDTIYYPTPPLYAKDTILIYNEDNEVQLKGRLKNGKRIGLWSILWDNKVETQFRYNRRGQLKQKIRHYANGGYLITPYKKGLKHGKEKRNNAANKTSEFTHYKKGIRHGLHAQIDKNGKEYNRIDYQQGRAYSIDRPANTAYLVDGFKNGYHIYYHYKTKEKLHEGAYWNGYKIGTWIRYIKNGSYCKQYYPSKTDFLMGTLYSEYELPLGKQCYTKYGLLIDRY